MSERGISYRQSWLRQVMDGKVAPIFPETKALLSRDSLLDATLTLFNECEQQKRTNFVTSFVKKYKDAVTEIQQARVVPADFEVLDLIGRGQFGKVELVRAKYGTCNTFYALKTVPKKLASDSSVAMSVWEERDILVHANSQWLTQAHYAFQDDVNLYLVMDYVPGGDLYSLMRRQEDLFTENNVRFYLVEILLCISAVHHMGYVHRDIKPENILLDQRGHLKLVDFGSAIRIGSLANGHCVGTVSYMSPEALQAADPDFQYEFGPEVDFWALGIVLYEMLYYRNPFISDEENESSIEIIRNIMDWRNSLIFDDDIFQISDTCRSLITNLVTDREQRFGFKEISQHPFLASVGISQIGEKTPPFIPQVSSDADTSNFEPPVPGLSHSEVRYGRKSFAGGDSLSQVAFVGYTYSSAQSSQGRKTRARTSLAFDGIPVSTLERKWADRNNELRMRCQDLERQITELGEKRKRMKPTVVDAETWTSASDTYVAENRKDIVKEKSLKLEFVHSLEEEVRQWATHTLLEVFARLRPWFRRLNELYTVVVHVTAGRFETLHWESTVVMVIDALFDLLCSHWATHVDDEQLRYLSDIFVNTLEPYLASMDTLLAGSQVSSKTSARSELFMAKRGDIPRKDAIVYWRDAFTLKYFAGRGMILSSVPKLLHPFVHRLIVTVKSMDFLIVISEEKAMPELVKEIAVAPGAFVAGFGVRTSWLRSNNEGDKSLVLDSSNGDATINSRQDLRLGQFDLHEFVDNPLLRRAIAGALPDVVPLRSESKSSSSVQFSVTPLRLLLHNSLRRLIFERHLNVSRHLLTVLLDRLHLRRVLQHMCDIFLLRRGDLLDELTRYLFTRMQWPGAPWREQLPLNLLLHQCLTGVAVCVGTKQTDGVLTQEEAHRFWLTVEAMPTSSMPVQVALTAFDAITLHYQPAWPFEVMLTPDTITLYSSVFRFLLQLRRVKSSLEGLQFWTLERRHVEQEVNKREERPLLDADSQLLVSRLHVLRIKVLHIVNSLHQFLMHRIIHSAVIDFQRDIEGKVEDLVDLCSLHQHFVRRVYRCCLLGEKAEVFRKSFMKLLHLGVTIERVWLQGMDVITDQLLGKMETQFSDYTLFLHGVFKTAVKNVDFEYLEPLAMAFKDRGESASSRFSA